MNTDKSSPQYKVILKFANTILAISNLPKINDLEEFQNIDRDNIIKKEVIEALQSGLSDEIFALFDKKKCGYYKGGIRWPLLILRNTVKEIGYQTTYIRKSIDVMIDGEKYKKPKQLYFIKPL